jgi:hypothetical protein
MAGQLLFDSLSNNTRKFVKEVKGKMRTNTRKFSLVLTALVLSFSLIAVPAAAGPWDAELRAEITSPQEGECIAVGSTFTVEVTIYNDGTGNAEVVDVNCVLNGGWPQGEYRDNLSFAAGEPGHGHKNLGPGWPPPGLAAGSSANLTWGVVCTGLGVAKIRINPSSIAHIGEADTVTFYQVPIQPSIDIDIKPGSDPNSINLKSKGVVSVAVLTTGDFDASTTDPGTVKFAGASPLRWALEDVDNDGDMDMLFYFKTQELDLDTNSTEATLTSVSPSGCLIITGTDTVNIVPTGK